MGVDANEERFEQFNSLTEAVIGAAMRVHSEHGPRLYESVYQNSMRIELDFRQLPASFQVPLPVHYRGQRVEEEGYRLDVLVDDTVILELKSVEAVLPRHKMQLSTYLRLKNKPVGLLINFNVARLRDGIFRIINPYWDPEKDDGNPNN